MNKPEELTRLLVAAQLKKLGISYPLIEKCVGDIIKADILSALKVLISGAEGARPEQERLPFLEEWGSVNLDASTKQALEQTSEEKPGPVRHQATKEHPLACYIYGIVRSDREKSLGPVGIDNAHVYTLAGSGGLHAVLHNCEPRAYASPDQETAKKWLFAHQEVVEKVCDQFGAVLPMGFNNIVFVEGKDPHEIIKNWLTQEEDFFNSLLQRLRGKQEFGVKILAKEEVLKNIIMEEDEEIQMIKKEMAAKPLGTSYMFREKLEQAAREALEQKLTFYFREIYQSIKEVCEDIHIEKTKNTPAGQLIIANLSCLLAKEKTEHLGQILSDFSRRKGFSVSFTGPWPPYSFVGRMNIPL